MLDKLEAIKNRFDEVSELIVDPNIISNMKQYIQLNKEYKAKGIPRELEYKYEILYNIESHELFYVREINRKFQHYSQNIRTEIAAKCTPN